MDETAPGAVADSGGYSFGGAGAEVADREDPWSRLPGRVRAGTPDDVATADTPTAGFFRRCAAGLPLLAVRDGARC